MTEDEMFGWYHLLHGHEFEQALVVGDREAWHAAVHGVAKSQVWLSNWTELESRFQFFFFKKFNVWFQWILVATCGLYLVVGSGLSSVACLFCSTGSAVVGSGLVELRHVESSQTRDWTQVPFIGSWILSHWTTREVLCSNSGFIVHRPCKYTLK